MGRREVMTGSLRTVAADTRCPVLDMLTRPVEVESRVVVRRRNLHGQG